MKQPRRMTRVQKIRLQSIRDGKPAPDDDLTRGLIARGLVERKPDGTVAAVKSGDQ